MIDHALFRKGSERAGANDCFKKYTTFMETHVFLPMAINSNACFVWEYLTAYKHICNSQVARGIKKYLAKVTVPTKTLYISNTEEVLITVWDVANL